MSFRLNTRETLRGRTVQFKEAARRPLPVLLPSAYSHARSPVVNVRIGGSQILRSTVLTVWAGRMEGLTSLTLRTLNRRSFRIPSKTPNHHQRGV